MQLDRTALRQLPRALQIEVEENVQRAGLNQVDLADMQRRLLGIIRAQAQPGRRTDLTDECQFSAVTDRATAVVGRLFGESHKTVEYRQAILAAAESDPVGCGPLLAQMNRTGQVKPAFKQLTMLRRQQAHAQRVEHGCTVAHLEEFVQHERRFGVIYSDNAWPEHVNGHYTTMTVDDMAALPVPQLAADDCALVMWTTKAARMRGWCLELVRRWGFELVDDEVFHWIKQTADDGLFIGRGQWTRTGAETCWLATKGSPQRVHQDVRQVILAPVGEHSEKPEAVRHNIERLFTGPYLELFARRPPPNNWSAWGNELAPSQMHATPH